MISRHQSVLAEKRAAGLDWFQAAKFGMFVHFGLNSIPGRGEWVMFKENIPVEEYELLMQQFNPAAFDALEWVDLARNAGARYLVVTSKHHDGFCLFDSSFTDYKISNTPFGRDMIGELTAACHKRDMPVIIYYSQPDWHHPNYACRRGSFKDLQNPPAWNRPDWPAYQEYVANQVRELCSNYGRIDGIWWDGVDRLEHEWRGRYLYDMIKSLQPQAVVNDRAHYGDYYTPEHKLMEELSGMPFEACETVTLDSWGYLHDPEFHSGDELLRKAIRVIAAGGNFLLNVGPRSDGLITEEYAARLQAVGDWLMQHHEAVWGTEPGLCFKGLEEVVSSCSGSRLNLFLLHWPRTSRLRLRGLGGCKVEAVPGDCGVLSLHSSEDDLIISGLPPFAPEKGVNLLQLDFVGDVPDLGRKPQPPPPPPTILFDGDRPLRLKASQAALVGRGVKGDRAVLLPTIGPDGSPETAVEVKWPQHQVVWRVRSADRSALELTVELSCPEVYQGSTFVVHAADAQLQGKVPPTGGFEDFVSLRLGEIELPAGDSEIIFMPDNMVFSYVCAHLRAILLSPALP